MRASKESARQARDELDLITRWVDHESDVPPVDEQTCVEMLGHIRIFLNAAERKLPTEAAFDRDKQRHRKTASV